MNIAIWIIAITEIVRLVQNSIQLKMMRKHDNSNEFKKATDEFIKSLNKSDAEFVEDMLREFQKAGGKDERRN